MKAKLLARIDQLDSLSRRDRMALALGLLALVVGVELMLVDPMHTKRTRVERSLLADAASLQEGQAAIASGLAMQLQAAQARRAELEAGLAALGLKDGLKAEGQREALASFLSRSQRHPGVVLVSTQGLPVEALNIGESTETAVAVPADAASAPGGGAPLFRHRTELTLEGDVNGLAEAIDLLERNLAPLRIERVRLASRNAGATVQATVVLTTINQERAWLAL